MSKGWNDEEKQKLINEIKENKLLLEICLSHKIEEGSIQNCIKKLIKEEKIKIEEYEKYLENELIEKLKSYDNIIRSDYGYTIVIPKFKKIYEKKGKKYESMLKEEQKNYLLELVEKNKNEIEYEIFYEEHENENIHCHGTLFKITDREIEKMRIEICKKIGITKKEQMKNIFHYMKLNKYEYWKNYCLKDQKVSEHINLEEFEFEKKTIEKLTKKIGSEDNWKQLICCKICKKEKYNPVWKNGYYAICKLCYKE